MKVVGRYMADVPLDEMFSTIFYLFKVEISRSGLGSTKGHSDPVQAPSAPLNMQCLSSQPHPLALQGGNTIGNCCCVSLFLQTNTKRATATFITCPPTTTEAQFFNPGSVFP